MKSKLLYIFIIFFIIILVFIFWINHINNEAKKIPEQIQESIKVDEQPAQPIFNIENIEKEDKGTDEQQEEPLII
ncbi:MAG: hypothetical protein AB1755_02820 [Candidatus Omnitrophota bacterium]